MTLEKDIEEYKTTKNKQLRDKIVMSQYPLVVKQVKKYIPGDSTAFSDLVHEGMTGIIKALDKFDSSLGYKFTTYAGSVSLGHIKDAIREYNNYCGKLDISEELNDETYDPETTTPLDYCCYMELADKVLDYLSLIKPARKTVFLYWVFVREYSRNNTESDPEWASRVDLCQAYQGVKKYLRKHIDQEYRYV